MYENSGVSIGTPAFSLCLDKFGWRKCGIWSGHLCIPLSPQSGSVYGQHEWVSTSQKEEDSIPPACPSEPFSAGICWMDSLSSWALNSYHAEHLLWARHFPPYWGYSSEETDDIPVLMSLML